MLQRFGYPAVIFVPTGLVGGYNAFDADIQYVAHEGQNQGYQQKVVVKMVIVRMSTVDSPKGLGIDQVVVEEVQK